MARSLSLALGVPVAGASTLDAIPRRRPGDRRAPRRGVHAGPARLRAGGSRRRAADVLVGDGAVRYRDAVRARGRTVPPDDDPAHVPDPLLLVEHAGAFGAADARRAALRARAGREGRSHDRRRDSRSAALELADLTRSRRSSSAPTRRRGRARCSRPSSRSRRRSASARSRASDLVGYVINSRYVDAWHVMNVAVDPEHQRRGIATRAARAAVRADARRRAARLHARGARLERGRDPALREARLRVARHPARLLHGQP